MIPDGTPRHRPEGKRVAETLVCRSWVFVSCSLQISHGLVLAAGPADCDLSPGKRSMAVRPLRGARSAAATGGRIEFGTRPWGV